MDKLYEINYLDLEENSEYEEIIERVINQCYDAEGMMESNLYISITLTTSDNIRRINKKYRNIDKETDVLSFPMFEKEEIQKKIKNDDHNNFDILGDMVISIKKVQEQAKEYEHSFEREFAYMIVHSFYHLLGYDHIDEEDRKIMRQKEENILNNLQIKREQSM